MVKSTFKIFKHTSVIMRFMHTKHDSSHSFNHPHICPASDYWGPTRCYAKEKLTGETNDKINLKRNVNCGKCSKWNNTIAKIQGSRKVSWVFKDDHSGKQPLSPGLMGTAMESWKEGEHGKGQEERRQCWYSQRRKLSVGPASTRLPL